MLSVTDELRAALALDNDAVQIQVCSDYNFHSEENFKVNYWTKVLITLSDGSPINFAISPLSLKQWWVAQICPRSLPGLRKVLYEASEKSSPHITTLSTLQSRFFNIFPDASRPATRVSSPSLAGRITGMAGSVLRQVWRVVAFGSPSDDEEETVQKFDSALSENEVLFCVEKVEQFSKKLEQYLHSKCDVESTLVTEADVTNAITHLLQTSDSAGAVSVLPYVAQPTSIMTGVFMASLVDTCKAVPFKVSGYNCLKLCVGGDVTGEGPTEADKAQLIGRIATEKLNSREAILTAQWKDVDSRLKEHLASGRKPLALVALRERKLIEQRLEEVNMYKLKLEESHSVTQTAFIQQSVLEAISVGTKASRAVTVTVENVEDVLEEANEMKESIAEISAIIGGKGAVGEDDSEVLAEYERMVRQQQGVVEPTTAAPAPPVAAPTVADLLDAIPTPPTNLPAASVHLEIPSPPTSAPRTLVMEEAMMETTTVKRAVVESSSSVVAPLSPKRKVSDSSPTDRLSMVTAVESLSPVREIVEVTTEEVATETVVVGDTVPVEERMSPNAVIEELNQDSSGIADEPVRVEITTTEVIEEEVEVTSTEVIGDHIDVEVPIIQHVAETHMEEQVDHIPSPPEAAPVEARVSSPTVVEEESPKKEKQAIIPEDWFSDL